VAQASPPFARFCLSSRRHRARHDVPTGNVEICAGRRRRLSDVAHYRKKRRDVLRHHSARARRSSSARWLDHRSASGFDAHRRLELVVEESSRLGLSGWDSGWLWISAAAVDVDIRDDPEGGQAGDSSRAGTAPRRNAPVVFPDEVFASSRDPTRLRATRNLIALPKGFLFNEHGSSRPPRFEVFSRRRSLASSAAP